MSFTNPFGEEPHLSSDSQQSLTEKRYRDLDKDGFPILISIRSARNSVSSLLNDYMSEAERHPWWAKTMQVYAHVRPLLVVLLPAFIVTPMNRFSANTKRAPPKRLHPTAYLDGLRGVAAFVVYIFHMSYLWFPKLRQGFHSSADNNLFWQRTMVRIFHSGRSSVTLFFVISGYVLTIRSLHMIYGRKNDQILNTLAGSAFRRPLRLYLPIIACTFVMAVMVHFGFYIRDTARAPVPPVKATLVEQLHHWFWDLLDLVDPFKHIKSRENIAGMKYDGHLWTIPVEFKGSFLVFTITLMFARARRWIHITATFLVVYWLVQVVGDWDKALFPVGLLLAELSIIVPPTKQQDELPRCNTPFAQKTRQRDLAIFRHVWTISLFFIGIHMMCYPENKGSTTPGFRWMSNPSYVPPYFQAREDRIQLHWNSIGAILFILALMYSPPVNVSRILKALVGGCNIRIPWHQTNPTLDDQEKVEMEEALSAATAPRSTHDGPSPNQNMAANQAGLSSKAESREPFLQRLFTTSFSQYLGRISYSLYLWHGMVNHTVGVRWLNAAQMVLARAERNMVKPPAGMTPEMALAALNKTWSEYGFAFFWGMLINTLVLLWVSDVFNRLVDDPAVRLTRWISEKSFRKD